MKVAILYGGKSGEHEVSILSAHNIIKNISTNHKVYLIGISKTGTWYLQPDVVLDTARDLDGTLELRTKEPIVLAEPGRGLKVLGQHGFVDLLIDAVFPVLHGSFGEDGTVQGLLECCNLPYVGANVLGSSVAMDKESAKALWQNAGLPIVPCISIRKNDLQDITSIIKKIEQQFSWPVFVKPSACGSSVGSSKVASSDKLLEAINKALSFDTKALIEPFIPCREIECSVLGNDKPEAFAPGEIITSHDFYNYEAKYVDPDGAKFIIPAPIEESTAQTIKDMAIKAYKTASITGMARVDFFIDKVTGAIYLNEANTIPGFTSISMYPKMCEAAGLSYTALIESLLNLALEQYQEKSKLQYEI